MAEYDLVHSGSIDSTLHGLDQIDAKVHVPEVVKSDATVHVPEVVKGDATMHVPEPVTIDSSVDVKPMAVDSCVRVVLGPVPPTRIRTPWEQRVAVNILGVELFSVSLGGEASTYIDPVRAQPVVAGDIDEKLHGDHDEAHEHEHGPRGLEIRIS
ncbi:MAG: hypothetical protein ACJ735_12920 [Actinomycetes bacterium]